MATATVDTFTIDPTTVSLLGADVQPDHSIVYIYEQTAAGTPSGSNVILLGETTTTNGTTFQDPSGDNFAATVVVVIAHPASARVCAGSLVANTNLRTARTEARLAFAVLTTERKAA